MCGRLPVYAGCAESGLQLAAAGRVLQSCGYDRNRAAVRLGLIIHGTENNIDILPGETLHKVCRIAGIRQGNITGYIKYDIRGTADGGFQKRALHGHFHGHECLVVTLALADTDMCDTLVLHDSLDVRKIQVDDSGQIDQVRDTLNRLLKHFVRLLQSLRHGSAPVHNLQKLIIGNHDQRIHMLLDTLNTAHGIHHTRPGLKTERLGNHTYRKNSHILCKSCHHRRRAGPGTAAHTAGDKHHVRAFQGSADLLCALLGRFLSDLRLRACPQSLGQLLTDLQQCGRLTELQRLFVGVHTDKLHPFNLFVNHSIHSIVTCTAHTDHNNLGSRFSIVCLNFKQECILLFQFRTCHTGSGPTMESPLCGSSVVGNKDLFLSSASPAHSFVRTDAPSFTFGIF